MGVDKIKQVSQARTLNESVGFEGECLYGRYTYGIAGEKFFREIMATGKLLGTKCPTCNLTYFPPRIYCERCFNELKEWVEVPKTGEVFSFTISHVDLDGNRLDKPVVIALVKFAGIYGGLVHRLELKPEEAVIDMPVEVVFQPIAQRVGSILDIKGFRPLKK